MTPLTRKIERLEWEVKDLQHQLLQADMALSRGSEELTRVTNENARLRSEIEALKGHEGMGDFEDRNSQVVSG